MHKIYFDTNAGSFANGYYLWFTRSLDDLSQIRGELTPGLIVELYMPEELTIKARLDFDKEMGHWIGIPIKAPVDNPK